MMTEGTVAELIGKTLEWAIRKAEGIPMLVNVEARDLGEIDVQTIEGECFRLTVTRIEAIGS
jgi:hypothetical protein